MAMVTIEGREAIVQTWQGAMGNFDRVSFSCVPSMIAVDGDTAIARCQTQEVLKGKDGSTRMIGGLYSDRLAKREGAWVYTHRAFEIVAEYNAQEEG